MNKYALLLAATGLMSLAACNKSPEAQAVDNNAALIEDSLENAADNMEALADNTADTNASEAMENAADNLEDMKGNVADAAEATTDNMK